MANDVSIVAINFKSVYTVCSTPTGKYGPTPGDTRLPFANSCLPLHIHWCQLC